jgi:hypothetical protein
MSQARWTEQSFVTRNGDEQGRDKKVQPGHEVTRENEGPAAATGQQLWVGCGGVSVAMESACSRSDKRIQAPCSPKA